jgi:hypothetical protein
MIFLLPSYAQTLYLLFICSRSIFYDEKKRENYGRR